METRELKGNMVVIYPNYIECSKSRKMGRRIGKENCVDKVRIKEIEEAASYLGLKYSKSEGLYPRDVRTEGRIFVEKMESKLKTLKTLAEKVKEIRDKGKHQ
jgi:signal recognition particle subunit SRP19